MSIWIAMAIGTVIGVLVATLGWGLWAWFAMRPPEPRIGEEVDR